LSLDEFDSYACPKELFFFREKIVSWLGAGSFHSMALSIEGYAYTWGRNDKGQLGLGKGQYTGGDSKNPCPKIVE
jgi:alpha-tubulin suppressor-like RCC1 family protein